MTEIFTGGRFCRFYSCIIIELPPGIFILTGGSQVIKLQKKSSVMMTVLTVTTDDSCSYVKWNELSTPVQHRKQKIMNKWKQWDNTSSHLIINTSKYYFSWVEISMKIREKWLPVLGSIIHNIMLNNRLEFVYQVGVNYSNLIAAKQCTSYIKRKLSNLRLGPLSLWNTIVSTSNNPTPRRLPSIR